MLPCTISKMTEWPTHAVVLPGTGSDARFAADAFERALATVGIVTHPVEPDPGGIVASYESALEEAVAANGPIVIGGISIGAAVAASWTARNPDRVFAILAALPPWIGNPGDAPAAASARYTARQLTDSGLNDTIAAMTATTPRWLADTLSRSWRAQWPQLPSALVEAAEFVAPDREMLRLLRAPTAIVAAVDDPVHPLATAEVWNDEIVGSSLSTVTLADIGADPGILGDRAVEALTRAFG